MKKIFTAVTSTVETASTVINDTLNRVTTLSRIGGIYLDTLEEEAVADAGCAKLDIILRVKKHKIQHDKDVAELDK